jgi:hypothetical protein
MLVNDSYNCYKFGVVFFLHLNYAPLLFVDECIWSNYVIESDLGLFLTNLFTTSFTPLTLTANCWMTNALVDGDLLTTNNCFNVSILSGLPNVQEFLQQVCPWNYLAYSKQATQISLFYPLSFFGSHSNPLKHFLDFFCFNRCSLSGHFGGWTALLHLFLSLAPHCALGSHISKYNNSYVKGIRFHVKKTLLQLILTKNLLIAIFQQVVQFQLLLL